jgi:hypothetical protein
MVLGMNLETFTLIHVLISLVGIASGLVVLYGFLTNRRLDAWTAVFLLTTALTSLTGFLFPFTAATPAIKLGIISLVVLAIAIVTRYLLHLTWRKTYVIAACIALYFNVFVLVVQSFEKVPSLKALAPTQKEPPFAIAQIAVLLLFVALMIFSVKRFRNAG